MLEKNWFDLGSVDSLKDPPLREVLVQGRPIALSYVDGKFGAVLGVCTHVGGPLGKGKLDGDYITCPWHYWQFHRITGSARPGFEDKVPQYDLKTENGHLFINVTPTTKGHKSIHPPHPLARPIKREDGPIRVVGISTTIMDSKNPRYSTSDKLLEVAINYAKDELSAQTMFIRLNDLKFRACEGFYSKSAFACTWPCSITQMDETDQLSQVYEALIHWADVVIVATPIRWGAASSLYHKMIERMNCVQNQITLNNKVLIQNKVASFIITGGQDNVQDVAGHMLGFFSEFGFVFPPFPFIAHTMGWDAEDMERNTSYVEQSDGLKNGAKDLVRRSIEMAKIVLRQHLSPEEIVKAGRKAQHLTINEDLSDAL